MTDEDGKHYALDQTVFPHTNYFIEPVTTYWVRKVVRVSRAESHLRGIAHFKENDDALAYVKGKLEDDQAGSI